MGPGAPTAVFVTRRPLTDLTGYARYSQDILDLLRSVGVEVQVASDAEAGDAPDGRWLVLSHLDAVRIRDLRRWRHRPVVYVSHNEEVSARLTVARFDRRHRWVGHLFRLPWIALRQRLVVRRAEGVVAISEEDASRFRDRYGVDPIVVPPRLETVPSPAGELPPRILLWGSYRWSVKRENASWALRSVIPLVEQDVGVTVAGLDADRLHDAGDGLGDVAFEDSVADPSAVFAGRPLVLIAERQSGGVKLKTLDAAAAGCPIVSTPPGIEGTGLSHGRGVLVGRTPAELAVHVDSLLGDWPRALSMGETARSVVRAYVDDGRATASDRLRGLFGGQGGPT